MRAPSAWIRREAAAKVSVSVSLCLSLSLSLSVSVSLSLSVSVSVFICLSLSLSADIFLLGPVAWYGMLRSGLHPALSLCFIVPLMPNSLPPAGKAGSVDEDTDSASIDSSLTIDTTDDSAHESASAHHEFRSKIPLFHFEHSAKVRRNFDIICHMNSSFSATSHTFFQLYAPHAPVQHSHAALSDRACRTLTRP